MKWTAVWAAIAFAMPCRAQDTPAAPQVALGGPRFLRGIASDAAVVDPGTVPALQRRVTLSADQTTLGNALDAITVQTGVRFLLSRDVVPLTARVRMNAAGLSIAAALTELLLHTGVDVAVVSPKELALVRRGYGLQVGVGAIVGHVKDAATKRGMSEVEVFLSGTHWRTTTDSSGRYQLADVEAGVYTLSVRRLGYAKQSRQVTVRDGKIDTLDVTLAAVATQLDSLVTTATGQQRRRDLGNAITTIKADSVLKSAPIRTLTDLLQDRVPGLSLQHTSGAPGDPAKLRLRGLGSVLHASDPVVIVDGVRIYAAQSDARSGNLTNALGGNLSRPVTDANGNPLPSDGVPAPSPLDQIDPNTIEKIEVFKGPSAATLYGADAANGVIVVTTKRGKPGPTSWSASVVQGRTVSPGQYPTGYYRWGRDVYTGRVRFCTLIDVQCLQDSLVQFQALNDPTLTVLGRGNRTVLSLTASGGAKALTYSVTGTYENETGVLQLPGFEVRRFDSLFNRGAPDWMQHPHQLTKWDVTSNITAQLGPETDLTLSTSIGRSEQQRTSLENQLAPLTGTYIDTVNGRYLRPANGYAVNNTAAILHDYYVRTTASTITVYTGLNGNWHPRTWFTAAGQAGLSLMPREDNLLLPAGLVSPTDSGTVVRATGRSVMSTFDVRGKFTKSLGRGFIFETNLGTNLTAKSTSDLSSSASGLVPGTSSLSGARRITALENGSDASVFGWYVEPRVTGQRLSLSTGVRLDGGSAYGTRITGFGGGGGGLLGLLALPKLNGSWVVSEEPWFPLNALFSSLRLRGAYGQAQVQPSPTDRLRLYTASTNYFGAIQTLTTVGNTHLRPERSTEFEGGVDADLLDSRVSVELTAYRKVQVDALMTLALSGSVNGGGSVVTNIGNIRNTGMELRLGLMPVRLPAAQWSMELNYSHNANTLTKLGRGVATNPAQGLVEGYPVGGRWARPIIGFADQNGDGVLQPDEIQVGDSMVYMGRLYPNYATSLFTNLALFGGALGITAGFNYQAGATQIDGTARTNWVLARALVDPAVPLNEQAAVLALNRTDYGVTQTVSTFRFNSFSVNYRAPQPVARLLRAQQLSVAVQGSNLALHSTYQGKDPDVNSWSPGENIVDTGQLPLPRTWELRFDLRY